MYGVLDTLTTKTEVGTISRMLSVIETIDRE